MTDNTPKVVTMNQHLDTLDAGKLSVDLNTALQSMVLAMEEAAAESGGKAKGSITISLDFKLDKGLYELGGSFKAKQPEKKRMPIHGWSTADGHLTSQNPRQIDMFRGGQPTLVPAGAGVSHA